MIKNRTRILSVMLLIIMLISIIPQIAYAFTPVDGIASAGGSGKSPGNPTPGGNSGVWSSRFQGFRISVLGGMMEHQHLHLWVKIRLDLDI